MHEMRIDGECSANQSRHCEHESATTPLFEFLEALYEGVIIVDSRGSLGYRNRAMIILLDREPEAELLLDAVRQLARLWAPARTRTKNVWTNEAALVDMRMVTGHATYLLRGASLDLGGTNQASALILIERAGLRMPTAARLRTRFRLTPREAEVALLLATGASDVQIGRALGVSIHTARHHGEHVFAKVGIHSRKALAFHLARAP